jgi:hypothetical protein
VVPREAAPKLISRTTRRRPRARPAEAASLRVSPPESAARTHRRAALAVVSASRAGTHPVSPPGTPPPRRVARTSPPLTCLPEGKPGGTRSVSSRPGRSCAAQPKQLPAPAVTRALFVASAIGTGPLDRRRPHVAMGGRAVRSALIARDRQKNVSRGPVRACPREPKLPTGGAWCGTERCRRASSRAVHPMSQTSRNESSSARDLDRRTGRWAASGSRLPWGLGPFGACGNGQRPTPGLPDPAVQRLQVFSTS